MTIIDIVKGPQREWFKTWLPDLIPLFYNLHCKMLCRNLLLSLGEERVPGLRGHNLSRREALDLIMEAGSGVIKPVWGCTSRGVFVLERSQEGLQDIRAGKSCSVEEWEKEILQQEIDKAAEQKRGIPDKWLVEEVLPDPMVYKVFCMGGEICLTLAMKGHRNRSYKWFSYPSWNEISPGGGHDRNIDRRIPPPRRRGELEETAKRVAGKLLIPFIRIDLYDTPGGIFLGELTTHPGEGNALTEEYSNMMYRGWAKAAEALAQSLPEKKYLVEAHRKALKEGM